MVANGYNAEPAPSGTMTGSWLSGLVLGLLTLILGIVVSFHPGGSLNVVAVLVGIMMLMSGLFHLVRVFDARQTHRVWAGITGLLFVVIGIILIRHLHLTLAVIGLVIGVTWVVQGLTAFIGGISGGVREGRAWWIVFGAVSLIAGIVVVASPVSSLNVLAVLLGIWFIILGCFEVVGGFLLRRTIHAVDAAQPRAESTL